MLMGVSRLSDSMAAFGATKPLWDHQRTTAFNYVFASSGVEKYGLDARFGMTPLSFGEYMKVLWGALLVQDVLLFTAQAPCAKVQTEAARY